MSTATSPFTASFYRPKKFIRPLRRQVPVFWLVGGVVFLGLIWLAIAWRNLSHERLERDVQIQWSRIERLDKEIANLKGQIKSETAHNRISKWAKEQRGWNNKTSGTSSLTLREQDLTTGARREAELLESLHD